MRSAIKRYWPVSVLLLAGILAPLAASREVQTKTTGLIDVLFSPRGGCQERIVKEIGEAKKSVRIQAYSFTNAAIAKAILDAKKRGVACEAILDKSNRADKYSAATFLKNQAIPVYVDARHAIAHNKVIIIDDVTLLTGSYNFSKAAEDSNAENLLILKGVSEITAQYLENYQRHKEHSEEYIGMVRRTEATDEAPASQAAVKAPQPKPDAAKADNATGDQTVYITSSGSKYHSAGCTYLRKSSTPMKLKDARSRYSPCSRCRPPE